MPRQRTIYFNDARHYYLFVFEPPMALEDAWIPIDECAGTAVDTFIYGVARVDGVFYPSKIGQRFRDNQVFESAPYYRAYRNMQSLVDRGLDPLTVLIDRAHDKGMEFIASLRVGLLGATDPSQNTRAGGAGFLNQEIRDHNFDLLRELAIDYPSDGIELDLAAPPRAGAPIFRPEDVAEHTPLMTEWVRSVSEMVHGRPGSRGVVGARVYPTEETNTRVGYDVKTWLAEGLVDYVTPLIYSHFVIDSNMPIQWLIDAAHQYDVPVYPLLGPYSAEEQRDFHTREWATPEMMRAAFANYWDMGVDGLYAFFFKWPIDAAGKLTLTEMGDPELVADKSKHYLVGRKSDVTEEMGYHLPLPIEIAHDDTSRHDIPIRIADDIEGNADRIKEIRIRMLIADLVTDDDVTFELNGKSLEHELIRREYGNSIDAYWGQWLEFMLEGVRPNKGENTLSITLNKRAEGCIGTLVIEDVETIVEYHPFRSRL